jgi:hypothetical protein
VAVAGIDFDTKRVHVVLIPDEGFTAEYHRIWLNPAADYGITAARTIRRAFPTRTWWEDNGVWLAGIEQTFSHDARTAGALGRVQGAVLACLPAAITVVPTPSHEWLRTFTGRAKLPVRSSERKKLAREQAQALTRLELDDWPDDGCDAYGIACAVRAINEDGIAAAAAAQQQPEVPTWQ